MTVNDDGDLCHRCEADHDGNLAAHEALYGDEEREMELRRQGERRDGVDGYWDANGWNWYDD